MIALAIQYFLCVLPMGKIWHLSGKFDQHLSLHCGSVKKKKKKKKKKNPDPGRDIGSCGSLDFQNLLTIFLNIN